MSRGWWLDEREPARVRPESRTPSSSPGAALVEASPERARESAPARTQSERPAWTRLPTALLAAVLVIAGCVGGIAYGSANVFGAMLAVPVLVALTALIARRLAVIDGNRAVYSIVMAGFVVKCAGVVIRYVVTFTVYGANDSQDYHNHGQVIAHALRHGKLVPPAGHLVGTNFLRLLAGIVYTIGPMSKLYSFLLFGWLAYIGVLLFWRAYRKAISDRNDLRYLQWLIFLPTMVYWPSSLGKDSWMVLCIGLASYGVALVLTTRPMLGWLAFAIGIAGVAEVRPHLGLILLVGLLAAVLFRKWPAQGKGRALFAICVVAVAGFLLAHQASRLGVQVFSRQGIQKELKDVGSQTSEGGSQFTPVTVHSPVQFPLAAFTVLFRPLPFEAHNAQAVLVSLEGVVVLGALVIGRRRWIRALRCVRSKPYVLYCIGAIVVFVIAYSSFSNFGLLARQRSQIAPLLVVFLAFPSRDEDPFDAEEPRATSQSDVVMADR